MKTFRFFVFVILVSTSLKAQDALNCTLLTTSGTAAGAYKMAVQGNIAYLVNNTVFSILNISNIYKPVVLYKDSTTAQSALNSIFVDSYIAYIAAGDGLIIMDVLSTSQPKMLAYMKTNEYIEEVIVKGNTAYLGTLNYAFLVINIADRKNPVEIARVERTLDDVWGLDIKDTLLFAASEDTGLKIFDVSEPSEPVLLSTLLEWSETITDVKVKDSVVYFTGVNLHAYNISDPLNPEMIFTMEGIRANAIYVEGNYIYCLSYGTITVIDISNKLEPRIAGYYNGISSGFEVYAKNKLIVAAGQSNGLNFIQFDETTGITDKQQEPNDFHLSQNYPNPFNPSTKIIYSLKESGPVTIKVFDALGQEIKTLVNEFQQSGSHSIDFNSTGLSSGIYYYRIITENYSETKKMVLTR